MKRFMVRGNNIVVMQGEKAGERKGILLPDSAQEAATIGEVIAVGPEVVDIEVGDTILIPLIVQMRLMHTQVCDMVIEDKPALVIDAKDVAVVWPKDE